jgi:hypothetical protein
LLKARGFCLRKLKRKYLSWRTGKPEVVTEAPSAKDLAIEPQINNHPQDLQETTKKSDDLPRTTQTAKPIQFEQKTLFGVSFYQTTIDLLVTYYS